MSLNSTKAVLKWIDSLLINVFILLIKSVVPIVGLIACTCKICKNYTPEFICLQNATFFDYITWEVSLYKPSTHIVKIKTMKFLYNMSGLRLVSILLVIFEHSIDSGFCWNFHDFDNCDEDRILMNLDQKDNFEAFNPIPLALVPIGTRPPISYYVILFLMKMSLLFKEKPVRAPFFESTPS